MKTEIGKLEERLVAGVTKGNTEIMHWLAM